MGTVFGQYVNGHPLHTEKLSLIVLVLARQRDGGVMEELDRVRLLIAVTYARAEKRENLASGPVGELVDQSHVISVVEGHSPLLTLQEDPDPLRGGDQV